MRLVVASLLLVTLTGCGSHSSNLQVGNEQSYASLKDQREAVRTVQQYDTLPAGAQALTEVSAGRCHRSFVEEAPQEATVLNDLKIAAYAQGADGITDVVIAKESGLNRNCWYVLTGKARAFTLRKG
nr:MAG TPA: PUTATIVE OUTER MEMBRANE PROTEIN, SIGNAL PROTEIN, RCS, PHOSPHORELAY, MUCOIDITY [Caudoviricetes sp.]